jgi:hypothetical protein
LHRLPEAVVNDLSRREAAARGIYPPSLERELKVIVTPLEQRLIDGALIVAVVGLAVLLGWLSLLVLSHRAQAQTPSSCAVSADHAHGWFGGMSEALRRAYEFIPHPRDAAVYLSIVNASDPPTSYRADEVLVVLVGEDAIVGLIRAGRGCERFTVPRELHLKAMAAADAEPN